MENNERRAARGRTALAALISSFALGSPAFAQDAGAPTADPAPLPPLNLSIPHDPVREDPNWWRSAPRDGRYDIPDHLLRMQLAPLRGFATQQQVDEYRYRVAHGETSSPFYDQNASNYGAPQGIETSSSLSTKKIQIGIRIPTRERQE
jgi:hypothetical protein